MANGAVPSCEKEINTARPADREQTTGLTSLQLQTAAHTA